MGLPACLHECMPLRAKASCTAHDAVASRLHACMHAWSPSEGRHRSTYLRMHAHAAMRPRAQSPARSCARCSGLHAQVILDDLLAKDSELYHRNGLVKMLQRNVSVKQAPERFQENR